MKKTFFATFCVVALTTTAALAQNNRHDQFGPQRRGMRNMEMIADTAITNHLGLTPEQLARIDEINAKYKEQLHQQGGQTADGRRNSREERQAMLERIKATRTEFRNQVHEVLGDTLYIQFLEQTLDNQAIMMAPRGGMQPGQRNSQGGRRGDRGRMGGGQMGGGFDDGFGNDF